MPADARRGVLVVDDDARFAVTLAAALARRGYVAHVAHDAAAALATARAKEPDAAVVDLKLGADDGLALIEPLRAAHPDMRIVVLTGYASIATAVKAIKLGADDYLAKPVTASAVAAVLERGTRKPAEKRSAEPLETMSPRRLEWEHIQRVLAEHDGNISATARTLRMHRRTLQRKLLKRPTQG
ncbi:MAG TPA: response regulator [Gammaproteobacteria bacterium]|nr:response regulator [Gammaproteobacteria bacterium]